MTPKLTSKEAKEKTSINIGGVEVGTGFTIIAGPCSVESEKQTIETARAVKAAGADMLRGGAFKPRTSPYAFQGLGLEGLKILEKAREETGLPVVTEVIDPRDVSWVAEYVDEALPRFRRRGPGGEQFVGCLQDDEVLAVESVVASGQAGDLVVGQAARPGDTVMLAPEEDRPADVSDP